MARRKKKGETLSDFGAADWSHLNDARFYAKLADSNAVSAEEWLKQGECTKARRSIDHFHDNFGRTYAHTASVIHQSTDDRDEIIGIREGLNQHNVHLTKLYDETCPSDDYHMPPGSDESEDSEEYDKYATEMEASRIREEADKVRKALDVARTNIYKGDCAQAQKDLMESNYLLGQFDKDIGPYDPEQPDNEIEATQRRVQRELNNRYTQARKEFIEACSAPIYRRGW